MKILLTFTVAAMVLSCSESSINEGASSTQHKSLHWTPAMLEGHTLELLNEPDILTMSFNSKDDVIAVNYKSGQDLARGNAWVWNISDDGQLNILNASSYHWVNSYKLKNYSDSLLMVESDTKLSFKRYRTEAEQDIAPNP